MLAFGALGHGGNFCDIQSSAFSVPLLARPQIWTRSGGRSLPHITCKNGSHSSTQTACDLCWRSWNCYRQIPPLVRAVPSYSAPNLQKHKGMLLLCRSVVPSVRWSESRMRWRVVA